MRLATHPLLAAGISAAFAATMAAGGLVLPATTLADSPAASCVPAGDTGLTAAVSVPSGAHVHGLQVDAAGCDIGIFVGPGSSGTMVTGSTVRGANDHGIFVENASHVTIAGNLVTGNGVAPTAGINEDKALQLTGTRDSMVRDNRVVGNVADGGIGVSDNGPLDPGAPQGSTLHAGRGNSVVHNVVEDNLTGCGIVVAAYDPGAGVWDNMIVGNLVVNSDSTIGVFPPAVGGIVVATDPPGTSAGGNKVVANTITNSFIPGIIVHSNAPGNAVSDTLVSANRLANDGWGMADGPAAKVAIIVSGPTLPPFLPAATLSGIKVVGNQIAASEDIGICFSLTATSSLAGGLGANHAGTPVLHSATCFGSE
ncbi:MAG TPA: right-handed parallel beta-helix repeat-containing protein [Candidatus Limnocylindrales bacterium]|nr:right-handed parallel beta-helix repeat-containing protein [Candidatus Limnocylindrales bacterium]